MGARGAVLDPPHVEHRAIEVDLVPAQVTDLGRPQPVAEGHQDHGGIPVAVAVALGGLDQGFRPRRASGAYGCEVRRSAFESAQLFGKSQSETPAAMQIFTMES